MNINDNLAGVFRSVANVLSSDSTAGLGTTESAVDATSTVEATETPLAAAEVKQHVKSESVGYTLADSVVRAGESVSESTTPITASRDPVDDSATRELSDRMRGTTTTEMPSDMVSKSVVNRPNDYSVAPALQSIEDVRTLSAQDIENNWEAVRKIVHACQSPGPMGQSSPGSLSHPVGR